MSGESGLNALAEHKDNIITPVSANEVAALVISNAGPANVGSGSGSGSAPAGGSESGDDATETTPTVPETTSETTPDAVPEATVPQTIPETAPEQEQVEPVAQAETTPVATGDYEEEVEESTPVVEQPTSEDDCDSEDTPKASASESSSPATPSKASSSSGSSSVQMYGQCGGKDFSGSTKCVSGAICKKMNEYYSQCIGSNSRVRRYVQV
jgi:outer membrane biosynthesis protein TonB